MAKLFFEGQDYNDDRIYVLHLCRCTVDNAGQALERTVIHHESPPENAKWCLATFRNTERYPAVRIDRFDSVEEARAYMEKIEPTTPLVSLGGRSPSAPLSYDKFVAWKQSHGLKQY